MGLEQLIKSFRAAVKSGKACSLYFDPRNGEYEIGQGGPRGQQFFVWCLENEADEGGAALREYAFVHQLPFDWVEHQREAMGIDAPEEDGDDNG